ncbi:MAG: TonB-dependent receptor [Steroidobacteraceae bacterium]
MTTTPGSGSMDVAAQVSSARMRASVAVAVALALGATGAFAQQAQTTPAPATAGTSESGGLQEVVVTATKRTENVQNVPISVAAFTTAALQERNITDIHSLTNLTPGVNLDAGAPFSGDRSVLSASIRGIGQDDFAFNLNPGVGVYLDGVFLARTIGSNVNLLDVDRVEILKGPQGTLFGANTIGGAISIITHTPGDEPRFIAQATGGKYGRRDVGFTADIPIIKGTLLSSLTVSSQNQTGWQKVIPYPSDGPVGDAPFVVDPQDSLPKAGYQTSDNYGGTGVLSMRGKVLWNASDKLNFTFTGDWSHEDQTALPYTVLGNYFGNLGQSTFSTLYNLCISNGVAGIPTAINAAKGPPSFLAATAPTNALFAGVCSQPRAQVPGLSIGGAALAGAGYVGVPANDTAFYAANPWVSSDYNYNNIAAGLPYLGSSQPRIFDSYADDSTGNIDTTYADGPDFARNDVFGFSITGVYSFTDDLQLKSITGYRQIKWNIGTDLDGSPETFQEVTDAQHQWQISQEFQLLGKALDDKLNYVGGLYYFNEAGYVHDYVPFESLLYVYDVANDVQNTDYAIFVHADYAMTDHWSFTAGGRYTTAQAYFLGGQSDLNSFPFGSQCWQGTLAATSPAAAGCPPQFAINPTASPYLRYFPNVPDSQAWHIFDPSLAIQYHFNDDVMTYLSWNKGFKAGGWTTRLSSVIPDPTDARYGPEYSKAWELGLKSEWFQHHLLVNAAVYYTDYDAIQLNVQQGISPVYQNAGNAKIKGAEIEFQSLIPGGLQLNGSASFIDAYYTYVNPSANIPEYALPDGTSVCPATVSNAIGTNQPACGLYNGPGNTNGLPVVVRTDAKLPKTPKWKLTFDPSYDLALPNEAIIRFLPAFTYTSEMYNDSLNTPLLRRPATRNLDASIHYISPNGLYDFAVGGTNLTNDRYVTAGSPNYGAGEVGAYFNPPIMWYLQVRLTLEK